MPAREDGKISRDQQIIAIVQEYLAMKSQGVAIIRDDITTKHPELLPELELELRKAEIVHAAQRSKDTKKNDRTIIVNSGLQRCPNCHNSLQIAPGSDVQSVACPTCGHQVSLLPCDLNSYTIPAKTNLRHYEVIEQLGIGAFGTVFKARDTKLDRLVAIKVPNKGRLSDAETEKFLREARAAGQLSHPNIAGIYEVADDGESPYIVSEFIRGINLSERLDSKKFTIQETVDLGRSIANALQHAHECGVTHRDLKPSNIMIDHRGEPHLLDFGLAKRDIGEVTMTSDGETVGTPAYMSPEQARGESHQADRRSDVYSLGAILYQLITDVLPFRGTIQGIIYQTIHDPPQPLSKLNTAVPKDLETIVLKCLEKDPKDRYDSAVAVEQELARFAAGTPIEARPIGPVTKLFRWSKRNRATASFGAIAILLLMSLSVVSSVAYVQTSDALSRSQKAEKQERLARRKSERLAERERKALIRSEEETKRAQRAEQQAITARKNETELRDKLKIALWDSSIKIGVRNPEMAALQLAQAGMVENTEDYAIHSRLYLDQRPTPVRAIMLPRLRRESGEVRINSEFSADEKYLLITTTDGRCRLWNLENNFVVNLGDSIITAVFCHQANQIALAKAEGVLEFLELDGMTVVQKFTEMVVHSLASTNGNSLAVATRNGDESKLQIFEASHDGTWQQQNTTGFSFSAKIAAMRFSNSSEKLVIACSDDFARLFKLNNGTWTKMAIAVPHIRVTPHGYPVRIAPVFLDNDNLIATVSDKKQVSIWGLEEKKTTVIEAPSSPFQISASHDQETLIISMYAEAWIIDVVTGARAEVSGFANSVRASVAKNNQVIITGSADRTVRFWNRSVDNSRDSLGFEEDFSLQTTHDVSDLKLSRNGNNLVVLQVDGMISVWDLRSRSVPVYTIRANGTDTRARFNASGNQIVLTGSHNHSGLYETQVLQFDKNGVQSTTRIQLHGILTSSRFSDDGKKLVTCSASEVAKKADYDTIVDRSDLAGEITVWSTDDYSAHFRFATTLPADALFSSDGKTLFALLFSGDVVALNAESGDELWRSEKVLSPITWINYIPPKWIELSKDGNHLFISGHHSVVWLDPQTGLINHKIEHHNCCYFDVSPDQTKIATSSFDRDVRVWEISTGEELCAPLEHPGWVFRVQFSPDGEQLLTACRDRNARVWNWRENKLVLSEFPHTDEVFDAFYHPSGLIVTASRGRFLQIWDSSTGLPLGPRIQLDIMPYQASISSDGQFLVAGGTDGPFVNLARLGSIFESLSSTDVLLQRASLISSRSPKLGESRINLTPNEWLRTWKEYENSETPKYMSDAQISTIEYELRYHEAMRNRDYRLALPLLNKLVETNPSSSFYYSERGYCHFLLNDRRNAEKDLRRAVDSGDARTRDIDSLSQLAMAKSDWDSAIALLNELVNRRPLSWRERFYRGVTFVKNQQFKPALEDFEKSIEFGCRLDSAVFAYAALLLYSGEMDAYQQFCRDRIELSGGLAQALSSHITAVVCLIGPTPIENVEAFSSIVDLATRSNPYSGLARVPVFFDLEAASLFRTGDANLAIQRYESDVLKIEEDTSNFNGNDQGTTHDWLFFALACAQVGEETRASAAKEQAIRRVGFTRRNSIATWIADIEIKILLKEWDSLQIDARTTE